MQGFFIPEKHMKMELQQERQKLTSIRLGKVSLILSEHKPSILPFKGKFPLISNNSLPNYMDEYSKEQFFENLPRFLKNIVYQAEQIVFYDNLFNDFLLNNNLNKKLFEEKSAKEKYSLLQDFLDEEQVSESILEIKNYE